MHGQPTFSLPALHRSFASIEKGRNLFPTVQSSSQGKIFLFGSAFRERRQASASVFGFFPAASALNGPFWHGTALAALRA
jgi:hypothetical protein